MENNSDLICIYDDTKENINKVLLDIYAKFVQRELQNTIDN